MLYCGAMEDIATVIAEKYRTLSGVLNETTLRLWAAVEARSLGHGGVSTVSRAIGLSRTTVYAGLSELASGQIKSVPEQADGSGPPEAGARSWSKRTTRFCGILMPSSIPSRGAIRCRRSAGPAKAPPDWPKS